MPGRGDEASRLGDFVIDEAVSDAPSAVMEEMEAARLGKASR